jgi:hypothetical protein
MLFDYWGEWLTMFGWNKGKDREEYGLNEVVYVPSSRDSSGDGYYFTWRVGWVIGVTTDGPQSEVEYKVTHQKGEDTEGYWIPAELVYNQDDYMETFH